ncbi:MAG: helicase-exonuclease AddAB subunit AddA [Clostridia bacterium]|nr:helicase-exonuclease AddAB subunit AddA [Clostridia bacterium]
MARQWTDSQKNAIESKNGTVLVSAAAGSGKTAVLVERVIQRVTDADNPVNIENLLVVTFTKAAAAEMKERISKRLSELIKEQPQNQYLKRQKMYLPNAQISTMDSFCGQLVKENFEQIGIAPDYTLLSDIEHDILKHEVAEKVLEEIYAMPKEETENLLNLFTTGKSDTSLIESILSLYEFAIASPNPEMWIEDAFSDYFNDLPIHKTKWGEYSLNRLKEVVEYTKTKAEDIINDAPEDTNLKGALINDLSPVIASLEMIFEKIKQTPENWDEIKLLTESLKFSTFPRIPKDEKDCYYDELKGRRDSIKKYFGYINKFLICNEQEFYEDIEYLRPIMRIIQRSVIRFIELLQECKNENNTYYFSDILHFALNILVEYDEDGTYNKTDLAKELSENFQEIYIDEFQDTNEAQDTLFSAISKNDNNKFMVGDVKQSIYRFRQAMPEIFLNYKDLFNEYDGKTYPATINLDKNFRSRKGIVDSINFFFDFLMTKKSCGINYKQNERLQFGGDYTEDVVANTEVHIVETEKTRGSDLEAEARHMGTVINELINSKTLVGKKGEERPIKYSDICILMRAVKDKAQIVARELGKMGIPAHFTKQGGFFESREIVTMVSMLKIIDNPVQDIPLVSVMLSPLCPFTEDDLARYRSEDRKGNLYNIIKNQYDKDSKVKDFLDMLYILRTLSVTMDIGSLIRRVFEITSYDSIVGAMNNGDKRILNLELLINYAENYETMGGSGLSGFIRYLDKIRKSKKDLEGANELTENDDVVRIMSIHKSKGLEFPVVFIANCSSGNNMTDFSKVKVNRHLGVATSRYFPKLHKDFATLPVNAVKLYDAQEEFAEQIRVLYVAMTRAEEKLYLVGSMHDTEKKITDIYNTYYGNFLEPAVPLAMCSSVMQWIILAMLNHPSLKMSNLLYCTKNLNSSKITFEVFDDVEPIIVNEQKENIFDADKNILASIKEKLSYEYPFAQLSEIPIKYAASSIQKDDNFQYFASERPAFLGKDELTPAQRGTLAHKFMENCDFNLAKNNVENEIDRLKEKDVFTSIEADAINISALKNFFESDLYDRINSADLYVREKEFTMNVPLSFVRKDLQDEVGEEQIVIQGVIDGIIINGKKGEIVDYKTDKVNTPEELCERYREQMRVYKVAAEQCFGLENVTVTLYSFSLSKEISVNL